jgi:hypothetical protein
MKSANGPDALTLDQPGIETGEVAVRMRNKLFDDTGRHRDRPTVGVGEQLPRPYCAPTATDRDQGQGR